RGGDLSICEMNSCCIVSDGTPVQEIPGFAVSVNGPTADDPRIKEIKPLLARPVDLPVRFSDQHCLALVDRDLVRTDLDLEWHDMFPWLWSLHRYRITGAKARIRLGPTVADEPSNRMISSAIRPAGGSTS